MRLSGTSPAEQDRPACGSWSEQFTRRVHSAEETCSGVVQVEIHRGDVGAVCKLVSLQLVEVEGLVKTVVIEMIDLRSGQQLLHHDHRVANLGH